MAVEKYIAAASLGLFVMFVGEIISLYVFMIDIPESDDPFSLIGEFEPEPKILQFISIGVAPAVILAGTSFIMAKRYGSKQIGIMIIAGGIILLIGMAFAFTLLDDIEETYNVQTVNLVPPLFMGISIPIIVVGIFLLRIKKSTKKDYV
jgi:hypothetical protein